MKREDDIDTLLEGYPWLEREDILACLAYAHRLAGHEGGGFRGGAAAAIKLLLEPAMAELVERHGRIALKQRERGRLEARVQREK